MKYFASIQFVLDASKGKPYQQAHIDFLQKGVEDGHIFAWGKFIDASYGLTVFLAETLEEAQKLAEADPYVIHGVRRAEVHEWALKLKQ
jgi:uncharacterized protein YciI